MPKKSLKIDKFEGGLVNHYNSRDIPDNSLVEAQDVMVDILGKIRLMGSHNIYVDGDLPLDNLLAQCSPGYGLYAFSADYNMADESEEIEMLALQRAGSIGIFDRTLNSDQIILTNDNSPSMGHKCKPTFFYINGALRVSDGYIEDVDSAGAQSHDEIDNKWFGYINRTLFPGLAEPDPTVDRNLGWTDEIQELVTPAASALASATTPAAGSLGIVTSWVTDNSEGEWHSGQLDTLTFGYSWLYDDEKQESKIVLCTGSDNVDGTEDQALRLQVYINNTDFSGVPNRVTGFRIYWMGEGGDLFEDPFQLAEGSFVDGTMTGHNNTVVNFSVSGDYYITPAAGSALTLPTQPALTFRLVNGYKHDVDSIIARYKTAVIANGVAYIGNLRQNGRNYHDRMIKSAIGPDGKGFFDVFPSDNFLDVAVQDGDAITALEEFSDRLLQFKRKSLYIINISGDFEYIEAHHLHMGVDNASAVTKVAEGIAWVNTSGCYLFNGEGVINLITNKINPFEWKKFIGTTGMIGYIGTRQQLVIAGTFSATEGPQDIYIYDIRTGSWTIGRDKLPSNTKSNFISSYKNTLLFASNDTNDEESLDIRTLSAVTSYIDGVWEIPDLENLDFINTTLNINSIPVTNTFSYSNEGADQSPQEKIATEIATGPYSNRLNCNPSGNPLPLVVTMDGHLTDDCSDNISGPMVFSVPPVRSAATQVFTGSLNQNISNTSGSPDSSTMDFTLTALSDFGDRPHFAAVTTEQGYSDTTNGQEVHIEMDWGAAMWNGSVQNSSRDGYYVAEGSGYWCGLRAARQDGYYLRAIQPGKTSGIKLSGFTYTTSYLGNTINSSLLNDSMFYPVLRFDENGGGQGEEIVRAGMLQAVNMTWGAYASLYTAAHRVQLWGIITEDIGLGYGDKIVDDNIDSDLGFQMSSLRLDSMFEPINNDFLLAISFPHQVGGDIASQYTNTGNYYDVCVSIAAVGTEWTLTITGTDSIVNEKTLITVASYIDDWGAAWNSPYFDNNGGGSLDYYRDQYLTNGQAWYKPHTIIVKDANHTPGLDWSPLEDIEKSQTYHESYTITSAAGSFTVEPPNTVSLPSEGAGGRKIIVPKRGAAQDGGIVFKATVESSSGVDTDLIYTTNTDDNPLEIVEGFDQAIAGENTSDMNITSATKVEVTDLNIDVKVDTGVYTIEGPGLIAAGFTDDMEVELVAGATGAAGSNDGSRFLITKVEATASSDDILTINPAVNNPYSGLSAPAAQDNKHYDLKGGAIIIEDMPPQPNSSSDFSVTGSVESGKIILHEFTNSSHDDELSVNNTSSEVKILTKEFDFGDLTKKKNIIALYITHNNHDKIKVQYIINNEASEEISPEVVGSNINMHTVKYPIFAKNIRTFQVLLTSRESITNYEINDISVVYREKPSR